jgi:DNA-binding beta-propeller fold protein YncE
MDTRSRPGLGRARTGRLLVRALAFAAGVAGGAPARADLLVASAGSDAVLRYDEATGAFRGAFVPPRSGGLDQPRGMAFGPDGALYVASFFTDQVLRYDGATGDFRDVFVAAGDGGLDGPQHLLFDASGALLVSSYYGDSVLRYDADTGAFVDVFVASGSGGLDEPAALATGPDGALYVASSASDEVLRYDAATGAFLGVFVATWSGGLDAPTGLRFGADGRLYVSASITNAVLRYDGATGAFAGAFVAPASGGLGTPGPLGFGPDAELYVSSRLGDAVLRYDGATGAFRDAFVAAGAGGLDGPSELLFADLPALLGPFLCYGARSSRLGPAFLPRAASLSDALETADAEVRRPAALCNPAGVDGAGLREPLVHLESYKSRSMERHQRVRGMSVASAVGAVTLDTVKPDRLLVPSAVSTTDPVTPPLDPRVDSFKCYRVRRTSGTPPLPPGVIVSIADAFQVERSFELRRPRRLCLPADRDGAGIQDPADHLLCVTLRRVRGEPKHRRRFGVHTANDYGPERLDTRKQRELCLPATLVP